MTDPDPDRYRLQVTVTAIEDRGRPPVALTQPSDSAAHRLPECKNPYGYRNHGPNARPASPRPPSDLESGARRLGARTHETMVVGGDLSCVDMPSRSSSRTT